MVGTKQEGAYSFDPPKYYRESWATVRMNNGNIKKAKIQGIQTHWSFNNVAFHVYRVRPRLSKLSYYLGEDSIIEIIEVP